MDQEFTCIKILCVDDDGDFLQLLKTVLEKINRNLSIDTAASADGALQLFERGNHDIIISDYQMPGRSGLDLLEELREKNDHTPFILLTGKGEVDIMLRTVQSGAYYLRKRVRTGSIFVDLNAMILMIASESKRKER
ncbi:MAG: response regulator [Candidatus Odinarchaeota archaeon]